MPVASASRHETLWNAPPDMRRAATEELRRKATAGPPSGKLERNPHA
jgi:hypothetical protein